MPQISRNSKARFLPPRYLAFLEGDLTIDDLDEEEILRGQLRNVNGDFRGGVPLLVPQKFMAAVAKRQKDMYDKKLAPMVIDALTTLQQVMVKKNPQPGDSARVAAAKLVLERALGKIPERVEMKAEIKTWEHVLDGVLVDVDQPAIEDAVLEEDPNNKEEY
jgi:hypothetical protein